jgi:hypothetical protein
MKIQIVQKGTKNLGSSHLCPWYVDEPPPAKK